MANTLVTAEIWKTYSYSDNQELRDNADNLEHRRAFTRCQELISPFFWGEKFVPNFPAFPARAMLPYLAFRFNSTYSNQKNLCLLRPELWGSQEYTHVRALATIGIVPSDSNASNFKRVFLRRPCNAVGDCADCRADTRICIQIRCCLRHKTGRFISKSTPGVSRSQESLRCMFQVWNAAGEPLMGWSSFPPLFLRRVEQIASRWHSRRHCRQEKKFESTPDPLLA